MNHYADNSNLKSDESSVKSNKESDIRVENPKETFKEEKLKRNDENKVHSIESEKINDKQLSDSISENPSHNVHSNGKSQETSSSENNIKSHSELTE